MERRKHNPIRTAVEIAAPWTIPVFRGGEMIGRHPIATWMTIGVVGVAATIGTGYAKGWAVPEATIETDIAITDPGRADVVDLDLRIEETPLIAYTAAVEGSTLTIDKNLAISAGWLPDIDIGVESSNIKWQGNVDVLLSYDSSMVEATYEENIIGDKSDDRIVLRVPLEAFSTTASVQPGDRWEIDEDGRSLFNNLATAWTDSFTFLESVPGLGQVSDANRTNEQIGRDIAVVNTLHETQDKCTPEILQNEQVSDAAHDNIAEDAIKAVINSGNTLFDDFTIDDFRDMEKVVYLGDENDANPRNYEQVIVPVSQYADALEQIRGQENVTLGTAGEFECEISDEVVEAAADDIAENFGTTPRGGPNS